MANEYKLSFTAEEIDAKLAQITENFRSDIVDDVIEALGTPVFGVIDDQKNILLKGSLTAGTYTFVYEDANGEQTIIGKHEVIDENAPVYATTSGKLKYDNDDKITYVDTVSDNTMQNYYLVYRDGSDDIVNNGIYTESALTNKSDFLPIDVPEGATKVSVSFPNLASDVKMRVYAYSVSYNEELGAWIRVTNNSSSEYGVMTTSLPSGYEHIFLAGNANGYPSMKTLDLSDVVLTWE
jgi:hypothetical protein